MNKDIMKAIGFGMEVYKVEHGICPTCNKPIDFSKFKDELNKKEFKISGMCQTCQDSVFESEKE